MQCFGNKYPLQSTIVYEEAIEHLRSTSMRLKDKNEVTFIVLYQY